MAFGILARKSQSAFLNAHETTFLMLVTATVVMGAASVGWMLWTGETPHLSVRTLVVAAVAGGANIGFLILTHYATPKLRGTVINNLLALQPVLGADIGVVVFGERLTPGDWSGCGLILAAVILSANPGLLHHRKTAGG